MTIFRSLRFITFCISLLFAITLSIPLANAGKDEKKDHKQPTTISQVSFINDTEIQIYGSHLVDDDGIRVMMGSYELVVSIATDALIQASLPPGVLAGDYHLTVSKYDDDDDHHPVVTMAGYDLTVGAARAVDLENHTSNTGNPHQVTANQVGAATAVDLAAHAGNLNNPHAVTTGQIGAATPGDIAFSVAGHALIPAAHHAKTTTFVELTDSIQDVQIPSTIARIGSNTLNYVPKWNGSSFESGSVFDNGHVGIGTESPGQASLYVKGNVAGPIADIFGTTNTLPSHHVAVIENSRATLDINALNQHNTAGLAIILNNHNTNFVDAATNPLNRLNSDDHFVSFYSKDSAGASEMVGRIEGVSLYDFSEITNSVASSVVGLAMINPLSMFDFDFTDLVVATENPNWLSFTPPTASFYPGSLLRFQWGNPGCDGPYGSWDVELCFLGVDLNVDTGSLPTLAFNPGSLQVTSSPFNFSFNEPTIGFNAGKGLLILDQVSDLSKSINQSQQKIWSVIHDPMGAKLEAKALLGVAGGVTYASGAGDYAEWLERSDPNEEIHVAEIVGVKGGLISRKTTDVDHILVTSYKPIVLGNMPAADKEHLFEKVAFMGQTLVKVRGSAHKGDFILPSGLNDGVGIAVSPDEEMTPDRLSQVVGVVWSDGAVVSAFDIKLVNIAVGLRSSEVAKVVKAQQLAMDAMRADIDSDKTKIAALTTQNRQLVAEIGAMHTQAADLAALNAKFTAQKVKVDRVSSRLEMLVRAMAAGEVVRAEMPSMIKQ